MTSIDRVREISQLCGMSEEVVRAVLKAEAESASKSLLNGEKAVLLGRCIIKPREKDGEILLSCTASNTLKRLVQENDVNRENLQKTAKFKHITKMQFEELF